MPTSSPPRGRPSSRYPESLARVPLHRRGTSNTYERLEDLLREAGYKETRIFTPETDRVEPHGRPKKDDDNKSGPEDRQAGVRGSVGAVVGFLAGLMPGGMSRSPSLQRSPDENKPEQVSTSAQPQPEYSPPASPLVHKRPARPQLSRLQSSRLSNLTASSESLGTANSVSTSTTPRRTNVNILLTGPSSPRHPPVHRIAQQQLPHQPQKRLSPHANPNSNLASTIEQPQPSRAGAYLRHMASAPNMPKRPPPSPDISRRYTRHATGTGPSRKLLVLNDSDADEDGVGQDNEQGQPPLPRTWLETVARAVAFGGPGAYAGGPAHSHSNSNAGAAVRAPALRQTRSSLSQTTHSPVRSHGHSSTTRTKAAKSKSKGALSDHTNRVKGSSTLGRAPSSVALAPPPMFSRIQAQRSGTSESKVSQTRVVCRSAPVSRSGSAVRGAGRGDAGVLTGEAVMDFGLGMGIDGRGKERRRADAERGRGRDREAKRRDGVPSLARTRAEGDMWAPYSGEGEPGRCLMGEDGGDEGVSSSEEEGELDLAQILVPPKRQNSIRSLRKHLHVQRTDVGKMGRVEVRPGMGSRRGTAIRLWRDAGDGSDEGEDEDWGQGWRRKRSRRASEEEEEEHRIAGFLAGGGGVGKRRQGIPWAQWAGVGS